MELESLLQDQVKKKKVKLTDIVSDNEVFSYKWELLDKINGAMDDIY